MAVVDGCGPKPQGVSLPMFDILNTSHVTAVSIGAYSNRIPRTSETLMKTRPWRTNITTYRLLHRMLEVIGKMYLK